MVVFRIFFIRLTVLQSFNWLTTQHRLTEGADVRKQESNRCQKNGTFTTNLTNQPLGSVQQECYEQKEEQTKTEKKVI